jgi:hypothetical protein
MRLLLALTATLLVCASPAQASTVTVSGNTLTIV